MSITLTPDQQRVIEDAIGAGLVGSVDEFIKTAVKALPHPNSAPQPVAAELETVKPLQTAADIVLSHMRKVPAEVLAQMPADGASQHDHYIYGWPKREV